LQTPSSKLIASGSKKTLDQDGYSKRGLTGRIQKSIQSAESWLLIAHIRLVTRRIARAWFYSNSFGSDSQRNTKLLGKYRLKPPDII
jgi:hypothetical protein